MIKKNILLLAILFYSLFFYSFNITGQNSTKLSWDEIDYVNASRLGILENIFEFNSKNIFEHIEYGLTNRNFIIIDENKLTNDQIKNFKQNYLTDDIFELRHYHPPLLNIIISVYLNINPIENDPNLIEFKILYNSMVIFLILLVLLLILYNKNSFLNLLNSLIFISIFFISTFYINSINIINYHLLFGLVTLLYVYGFNKFINKYNYKNLFKLSFFTFLLFFCLETSIFVFFFSIIYYLLFNYSSINQKLKNLFILCGISFLFTIFLWPANLYNLSLIKTYSMYFYRLFISSFSEYSDLSIFYQIYNLFLDNIFIAGLTFYLLIIYFIFYKKLKSNLINLVLFISLTYFFVMIPFMHNLNYLFASILLLIVLCCIIINKVSTKYNSHIFLLNTIILTLSIVNFSNQKTEIYNNDNNIFNHLNENYSDNLYLVDGSHIFEYYSNNHIYFNLNLYSKNNPKFYIKNDKNYFNVESLIKKKFFDGIIIQSNRKYNENDYKFLYKNGYKLDNTFDNYLFFYY